MERRTHIRLTHFDGVLLCDKPLQNRNKINNMEMYNLYVLPHFSPTSWHVLAFIEHAISWIFTQVPCCYVWLFHNWMSWFEFIIILNSKPPLDPLDEIWAKQTSSKWWAERKKNGNSFSKIQTSITSLAWNPVCHYIYWSRYLISKFTIETKELLTTVNHAGKIMMED